MKTITTLGEPSSSLRLIQLTVLISLPVAMRKSTLDGLFIRRHTNAANNTRKPAATARAIRLARVAASGDEPGPIRTGSQAYRLYAVRTPSSAAAPAVPMRVQ